MKKASERESWRHLLKILVKCKTEDRLDAFLHLLLTMNEREYLIHRYRIVEALLTTSLTQREIAKDLEVSITKITDGSKAVQIISDDLRFFLTKEMKKSGTDAKTSSQKALPPRKPRKRGD